MQRLLSAGAFGVRVVPTDFASVVFEAGQSERSLRGGRQLFASSHSSPLIYCNELDTGSEQWEDDICPEKVGNADGAGLCDSGEPVKAAHGPSDGALAN